MHPPYDHLSSTQTVLTVLGNFMLFILSTLFRRPFLMMGKAVGWKIPEEDYFEEYCPCSYWFFQGGYNSTKQFCTVWRKCVKWRAIVLVTGPVQFLADLTCSRGSGCHGFSGFWHGFWWPSRQNVHQILAKNGALIVSVSKTPWYYFTPPLYN